MKRRRGQALLSISHNKTLMAVLLPLTHLPPRLQPSSQMAAMPPDWMPLRAPPPPISYDSAHMHPVFFGHNWRRAPTGLKPTAGMSPVAEGYIWRAGAGGGAGNIPPKL